MVTGIDYGYGDEQNYGYGDAAPDMDYGYGAPAEAKTPTIDGEMDKAQDQPVPRRKRRCSVTKFTLQENTPLTAASVINDFRNGVVVPDDVATTTPLPSPEANLNKSTSSMESIDSAVGPESSRPDAPTRKKSGIRRLFSGRLRR